MESDVITVMDLVTLLQHVPALLHACVDNKLNFCRDEENAHIRTLRLVNRELSCVAPMGLKSFTLTLKGISERSRDTNMGSAVLLQHARLKLLKVHLLLTGEIAWL